MANAKATPEKKSIAKKVKGAVKDVEATFQDPIHAIFATAQKRWKDEDSFRKDVTTSLTVGLILESLDVTDWL